eukprot:gene1953-2131_t
MDPSTSRSAIAAGTGEEGEDAELPVIYLPDFPFSKFESSKKASAQFILDYLKRQSLGESLREVADLDRDNDFRGELDRQHGNLSKSVLETIERVQAALRHSEDLLSACLPPPPSPSPPNKEPLLPPAATFQEKVDFFQSLAGLDELVREVRSGEAAVHLTWSQAIVSLVDRKEKEVLPSSSSTSSSALRGPQTTFNICLAIGFKRSFLESQRDVLGSPHLTRGEVLESLVVIACARSGLLAAKDLLKEANGYPVDYPEREGITAVTLPQGRPFAYLNYEVVGHAMAGEQLLDNLRDFAGIAAEEEGRFYYHGTSWSSAINIARGIQLARGQFYTDFGPQSFYLGDNLYFSTHWACLRFQYQPAVCIYYAAEPLETELVIPEANHLRFPSATPEWRNYVSHCRTDPNVAELAVNRLVSGPIAQNPQAVRDGHLELLQPIWYDGGIRNQWAVRHQPAADLLNAKLCLVVFFPAGTTSTSLAVQF